MSSTHPNQSTLFVGDSGYADEFKTVAQRLGDVDLALVPIGAYDPRWFMSSAHMNPEEALQVVEDVGGNQSLATDAPSLARHRRR